MCKFYIPCLFQYSSFGEDEKEIFSLTYGIWLIIFTIVSLGYYFILGSENYELETYFRNNKSVIPTAFLTTSWNFNYKKENICALNKKTLYHELQMYASNFLDEYDNKRKFSILFMLISNSVYIVFLLAYFVMFLVIFLVNSNRLLQGLRFGSFSNEPLSLPYKPIIPHIQTKINRFY